jgi:hypothetical protein
MTGGRDGGLSPANWVWAGLLALAATAVAARAADKEPAVELKTATYAQVFEAVTAAKGKVVLIDVWGDF